MGTITQVIERDNREDKTSKKDKKTLPFESQKTKHFACVSNLCQREKYKNVI